MLERRQAGAIMMVKILMLTGDAGEAQEIYYAKFRLEEEGWHVQIATTEKRVFHSVVHDFEPGFDTYTEKPAIAFRPTSGSTMCRPGELSRAGVAGRPRSRVSAKPAQGRGDRSALHRQRQADRGELPRAVACCWRRATMNGQENDVLPRPRTRFADGRAPSS